jgi:hypothetical protein
MSCDRPMQVQPCNGSLALKEQRVRVVDGDHFPPGEEPCVAIALSISGGSSLLEQMPLACAAFAFRSALIKEAQLWCKSLCCPPWRA